MSTIEIVVLAVAVLMFGGLAALLVYVERPAKEDKDQDAEKKPQ